MATFLLGAVSSGSLNYGISKADGFRYYAGFVQDDFKVKPRLTLNLGLRYDYIGAPTERFSRYSNFDPSAINKLTNLPGAVKFAGADFGNTVYPAGKKNFAPRIGFAYDLTGRNKIIVRGGYGMFYYQPSGTHILGRTWASIPPALTRHSTPSLHSSFPRAFRSLRLRSAQRVAMPPTLGLRLASRRRTGRLPTLSSGTSVSNTLCRAKAWWNYPTQGITGFIKRRPDMTSINSIRST